VCVAGSNGAMMLSFRTHSSCAGVCVAGSNGAMVFSFRTILSTLACVLRE
jgi:hypothetical protein